MTRTIASLPVRCRDCGGTGRLAFGDTFVGGQLKNWEAFRCSFCPSCYEADGGGRLADDLRRLVLAHRALRVDPAAPVSRLATLRAMRTLFGGTPSEARTRWALLLAGEPMTAGEAAQLCSLVPGLACIECDFTP